jgi:hypothetical protein
MTRLLLLVCDQLLARRITAMVVLGMALSGCHKSGETLQPVFGKVTFQGKPIAAGVVRFTNPQIGIDMTAELHPDGTYEVVRAHGPGLPTGTYQVAIMPPRLGRSKASAVEDIPKPPKQYPEIPEKYRDPSTSKLTLTVQPGKNSFDIEMRP